MKGNNTMNLLQKIKQYNTIIIHGHQRPDGDCYGAQFGLKNIIQTNFPNKQVYVVGETSDYVSFVGTPNRISDALYEGALSIVVDTAVKDRISDLRYVKGDYIFKVDHHIDVDAFGNDNWVDTTYPACSEMMLDFARQHDLKFTLEGAIAMYTGILTDTGRFRFRGVTKRTHELAGLALDQGIDVEWIDQKLSTETLEMFSLKGYIYSHYETTQEGFIYLKMTRDVIIKYGVTDEQAASMVNMLGGIEGYPVWALFIEYPNEIRIRLRSSGPTINELANQFEGGGHAKASGARLRSWGDMNTFIEATNHLVKNYKEGLK
jgi:bifunctional oligoribonuclease and PAP phosphatase NrnA